MLTLATSPGPRGDANWDWAWWGEPMIVMNAERLWKVKPFSSLTLVRFAIPMLYARVLRWSSRLWALRLWLDR